MIDSVSVHVESSIVRDFVWGFGILKREVLIRS